MITYFDTNAIEQASPAWERFYSLYLFIVFFLLLLDMSTLAPI